MHHPTLLRHSMAVKLCLPFTHPDLGLHLCLPRPPQSQLHLSSPQLQCHHSQLPQSSHFSKSRRLCLFHPRWPHNWLPPPHSKLTCSKYPKYSSHTRKVSHPSSFHCFQRLQEPLTQHLTRLIHPAHGKISGESSAGRKTASPAAQTSP
jgi:hypothetical protein